VTREGRLVSLDYVVHLAERDQPDEPSPVPPVSLCAVLAINGDRVGKVLLRKNYREEAADVSGVPGIFPPRSRTSF
jgi:hypothetical protein